MEVDVQFDAPHDNHCPLLPCKIQENKQLPLATEARNTDVLRPDAPRHEPGGG